MNVESQADPRLLSGVRVLVLTSGHEALDARVYGREAKSMSALGASVVVVGQLTRGEPDGVDVWAIPAPPNRLTRFLLQPWRCLWRGRAFRPDVVHFHDAEMLAVLPAARLLWPKARFVYDVHEDFANLVRIRDWLPAPLRPLSAALTESCEKTLARLAHGIVAVTPPLAARFSHSHKVSAFNFPTAEFFRIAGIAARPASDREYDLVHLGTLNRRRAEFLAAVIRDVLRRRPSSRFLVIGASRPILELLRERVPERCDLLGPVPHAEIPALLGNAKVGIDVHPWLQPHLRPALAVKICEYMAAGCAVVASSMPVLEGILSGTDRPLFGVRTIAGGEPGDYAEAVLDAIAAIERGEASGADLRDFALEHMNWENEAGRIASLYRALLGGGT